MGSFLVFSLAYLAAWCLWGVGGQGPGRESIRADASRRQGRPSRGHTFAVREGVLHNRGHPSGGFDEVAAGITTVPLLLELLGTALEAGLTVQGALQLVAGVSAQHIRESLMPVVAGLEIGTSWQNAWAGNLHNSDVAQIHAALSFGALTGATAAPLLYAQAHQCRNAASRQAQKRAAALGVKLVVPLGLCSLPAFIALGVVPVVMAMIPVL